LTIAGTIGNLDESKALFRVEALYCGFNRNSVGLGASDSGIPDISWRWIEECLILIGRVASSATAATPKISSSFLFPLDGRLIAGIDASEGLRSKACFAR
jgi:hypothetical protein